jgi:hypothetical protein
MQMNDIPKSRHGYPTWAEAERRMYSRYVPTREVMLKASKFVEKYQICNSSAMHMRTTDLDKIMSERKRTNFQSYFKFVESRPAEERVFLLTDDPKTQRIFLKKYGPGKIIVYSEIAEAKDQPPLFVLAGSNHSSAPPVLEEDHRFTTLEHTLIDVIIAAHAKVFKPSGFSSLSDLVRTFEAIGKQERGWCRDFLMQQQR